MTPFALVRLRMQANCLFRVLVPIQSPEYRKSFSLPVSLQWTRSVQLCAFRIPHCDRSNLVMRGFDSLAANTPPDQTTEVPQHVAHGV